MYDTSPRSLSHSVNAQKEESLVLIVDDDPRVREAICELILSVGMTPVSFASTRDLLLATEQLEKPGCLILDVRMPGASGLELQNRLAVLGYTKPIIFLTGHGDIPMTVQAMKAGAVDFFTKPVRDQALLDAVIAAIDRDVAQREQAVADKHNLDLLNSLTSREREVFEAVAQGRLNKQIAYDLGISEVTVKLHRSNVMRKMRTASIGELIRVWEALPRHARPAKLP